MNVLSSGRIGVPPGPLVRVSRPPARGLRPGLSTAPPAPGLGLRPMRAMAATRAGGHSERHKARPESPRRATRLGVASQTAVEQRTRSDQGARTLEPSTRGAREAQEPKGGGGSDLEVEISNSNLTVGDTVLFRGVSGGVSLSARAADFSEDSGMGGAFLQVATPGSPFSLREFSLGVLDCHRFLAEARCKLWWMSPSWGSASEDVPLETQFMLIEVRPGGPYALVMGLVDGPFRATVRPHAAAAGEVAVRVESGDSGTVGDAVGSALLVATGRSPYELISAGFRAASARTRGWRAREDKVAPKSMDLFGWCTWDAFYSKVDARGIEKGLRALSDAGVAPRTLIIDDGWQSVGLDDDEGYGWQSGEGGPEGGERAEAGGGGPPPEFLAPVLKGATAALTGALQDVYNKWVQPADLGTLPYHAWNTLTHTFMRGMLLDFYNHSLDFTKRLTSPRANLKMVPGGAAGEEVLEDLQAAEGEHEFGDFVRGIKSEWDLDFVYCWHAIIGYWGGVDPLAAERGAPYSPRLKTPLPNASIAEVEPAFSWDPASFSGIGFVPTEDIGGFYGELHEYLAASGVDGVKVDGQCGLGAMGEGEGGSSAVAAAYHEALEASVAEHFPGNHMINCMCHSTDNLYSHSDTAVARASDDFYPRDPASVTPHLANCAYNSVFMSEICYMDWDMFHSVHESAHLHAAARAVSGGAVYVSDAPGVHDAELLRKLVLPGGEVLRCLVPARPTRDCLFEDPQRDGKTALKVWNRNLVGGVVGAFNLQGSSWDRALRKFHTHDPAPGAVRAYVKPSDVEGLGEAAEYASWAHEGGYMKVVEREESVPVELAPQGHEIVTFVPIETSASAAFSFAPLGLAGMFNGGGAVAACALRPGGGADLEVRGHGRLVAYCSPSPSAAAVEGAPVDFQYDAATGLLSLQLPEVAHGAPRAVAIDA